MLRHARPLTPTSSFFFFNDTATTEIYPLSLHDALPISSACAAAWRALSVSASAARCRASPAACRRSRNRSEEHTSELQSLTNLVCRLLLEKKKRAQRRSRLDDLHVTSRERLVTRRPAVS